MVAKDSTRIRLHIPLERFSFLEGVLHGVVEHLSRSRRPRRTSACGGASPQHVLFDEDLLLMMRHRQRKVSANSQVIATILRCVQALRAVKDAVPASGPLGPLAVDEHSLHG